MNARQRMMLPSRIYSALKLVLISILDERHSMFQQEQEENKGSLQSHKIHKLLQDLLRKQEEGAKCKQTNVKLFK